MEICEIIAPQGIVSILLLIIVTTVLVIISLIDILRNEFEGNNKIIWVLVVLFLWFFGAIFYYLIGRKQKIKKLE